MLFSTAGERSERHAHARSAAPGERGAAVKGTYSAGRVALIAALLMEMAEKPIGIQGLAFHGPRWALLCRDDTSMVYVRRLAARKELPQRFEYRERISGAWGAKAHESE